MELYLASILVLSFTIIMLYIKGGRKSPPLPPGPKGLPIVGYMPFMGGNLVPKLTELGHKYGSIYKFYLGSKLCVVISSPSLVKELLREKDAVFCDRDITVAAYVVTFGGNGIAWSHPDDKWRALRKVFVQELMSGKRLDASYGLRRDVVRKAVRDVYANVGKRVDVGELSFRTTIDLVMNMVWGGTVGGEEGERISGEFRVLVSKVIDLMGEGNVSDFFPALAGFDLQGVKKKTEGFMRLLDGILDGVISMKKEKKNDDEGKKDFLQILLELTENSISLANLKSTVLDTVGGGTDTTSSTMEWAMAELINNPSTMAKAQKELSEVVGLNNVVEESHIPKLKYLEAVIKEALRLHPVGPVLIPRTPAQSQSASSTLGGYYIPINTKIFINVWSLHRDPSLWDKPSEFRPERFLQNPNDFSNQFQYIPFGSGRRVCPGKPLADRMAVFFLGSLLHSFDWKVADGEKLDMSESFRIVLRKSTPLLLLPSPRLPNSDLYK